MQLVRYSTLTALLLCAAIAGFFYAYSVSVMWGLNDANPQSAIAAMQGINRVVRNIAFAPAFFGTPIALAFAAWAFWREGLGRAALLFLIAAAIYVLGAVLPTLAISVPMNNLLAEAGTPASDAAARLIWDEYSHRWLIWNTIRMLASFLSLALGLFALLADGLTLGKSQ